MVSIAVISVGIGFGVELDAIRPRFGCPFDVLQIRLHEERRPNAVACECVHQFAQLVKVLLHVPTRVGRQHVWRVGHQRHLRRLYGEHQIDERLDGVTFNVQFCFDDRLERIDIVISDVSLVRARVHGNALCPVGFAIFSDLHHIGHVSATCIAKSRCFVDIDT